MLIPFYTLGSDLLDRELVYTNDSSFFSFQIDEPLQAGVGTSAQTFYGLLVRNTGFRSHILPSLCQLFLTDKKSRHGDDDSGMGPSISTGSKSTMVSEVTQVSQ